MPLSEHKRRLRAQMIAKRQGHPDNTETSFKAMAEIFLRLVALEKNAVISSYCAMQGEMDPFPLTGRLRACGHKIVLPVVPGKGLPLAFRHHEPGDILRANHMGILEPAADAPPLDPDILLVPLLAFDAARNRLGYGGGFYDRTIAALRQRKPVLTIGIAYAYQQVPEIPIGTYDVRLDKIVTEINVL